MRFRYRASIPSTGRGSSPRWCIISRPRSRSARPRERWISPCRPGISAISLRAMSPSAWVCRSGGCGSPPTSTISCRARSRPASLKQSGRFVLPDATLAAIREEFDAGRADETETAAAIRAAWREAGDLVDPHTAVALAVADRDTSDSKIPNIVLSTAHAAKFPDAVEAACGVRPPLPAWLDGLMTRPEHIKVMNNDQVEVERFVRSVSRAAKQGVAG